MEPKIKDVVADNKCTECLSCFCSCPKNAIQLIHNGEKLVPTIDKEKCVECKLCESKCHMLAEGFENDSQAFYYGNWTQHELAKKSSSGGVASAIAYNFLKNGGVVYGASLFYKDNEIKCQHIRINDPKDYTLIQGSKYIQSKLLDSFRLVLADLKSGKQVLFIGSSCQVAGLKRFIPEKEQDNLFSIDLVCHGVPKDNVFSDYISYLESKMKCKIIGISFRSRNNSSKKQKKNYVIDITYLKNSKEAHKKIGLRNSSFYRLFMARAGYRESCYQCKYANLNKLSDITLGDAYKYSSKLFSSKDHVSTIIVNTAKGNQLLENTPSLKLDKANKDEVIKNHEQLFKPSEITAHGKRMIDIYLDKGYEALEKYIKKRNALAPIYKIIKR